jgi:hypothetical protein
MSDPKHIPGAPPNDYDKSLLLLLLIIIINSDVETSREIPRRQHQTNGRRRKPIMSGGKAKKRE